MKDYINTALLTIIAGTLVYAVFVQKANKGAAHDHADHATQTQEPANSAMNMPISTDNPPPVTIDNNEPPPPSGPKTTMSFAKMEHNFGKVKQDSENKYMFKFTNTGTEPLIISTARGSCGCTVPKYPTEPIAPGKSGEIEVEYKPGKQQGAQTKTVTIVANTEPTETVLQIQAEVLTN